MQYGYARCSTKEDRQDIGRQKRDLMAIGIKEDKNLSHYISRTFSKYGEATFQNSNRFSGGKHTLGLFHGLAHLQGRVTHRWQA